MAISLATVMAKAVTAPHLLDSTNVCSPIPVQTDMQADMVKLDKVQAYTLLWATPGLEIL
jgi:hypothetical protein